MQERKKMFTRSGLAAAFFLAGTICSLTACDSQTANVSTPKKEEPMADQSEREASSISTQADHEPYLYEMVQKQPYRDTYKALINGVQPPQDYLIEALEQKGGYLGLYSASEAIEVEGSTYRIALACPANDACTEFGSAFLFTTDGRKAWAETRDGDKPAAYLGNPNNAQKQALDKRLDD